MVAGEVLWDFGVSVATAITTNSTCLGSFGPGMVPHDWNDPDGPAVGTGHGADRRSRTHNFDENRVPPIPFRPIREPPRRRVRHGLFQTDRAAALPAPVRSSGARPREYQDDLHRQGRPRQAPSKARRDGCRAPARDRTADSRREGARRPQRERRVRGRQERAGVRRGTDPDPRGDDQERIADRRAHQHRPRADRLDRPGRRRGWPPVVHDRRLRRGQAGRGPHLERVARRPRPSPWAARRARRSS